MLKNISILTTSMLLLAACEKVDKVKVNNQPVEEFIEQTSEDFIESILPVDIEIDIKHDDEPKG